MSKNLLLESAKAQGYVPKGCNLDGELVMMLKGIGEDPCAGCNLDRAVCKGRKKRGKGTGMLYD